LGKIILRLKIIQLTNTRNFRNSIPYFQRAEGEGTSPEFQNTVILAVLDFNFLCLKSSFLEFSFLLKLSKNKKIKTFDKVNKFHAKLIFFKENYTYEITIFYAIKKFDFKKHF